MVNAWLPRGGPRTTKHCWWGGRDTRLPTQLGSSAVPKASPPGGSTPSAQVFPKLTWMPACAYRRARCRKWHAHGQAARGYKCHSKRRRGLKWHAHSRAARGYRCHPKRRRGSPLAAASSVWPAELGAARAQTSQALGGCPVRPLRLAGRHAPRRCRRTTSIVRPGHRIAARTYRGARRSCNASWKNTLARETWSKAPTPSTDSTVASLSCLRAGQLISAPLEHSQLVLDLAGGHRHKLTENMRSDCKVAAGGRARRARAGGQGAGLRTLPCQARWPRRPWRKGVWLGKTLMNDSHLVACQGGLFVTRSV